MRILMAMHSLAMGGAEKFFVNLAVSLHERHEVVCYIPALACGDPAMIRRLGDTPVVLIPLFTPFGYKVFYKLTLMLQRRFPRFDPEASLHDRKLRQLHQLHRFDMVNSQLMEGTRQVCRAFEHTALPLTESDHGDFTMLDPARPGQNAVIFRRLDALICPSQANLEKSCAYPWRADLRRSVIPYGYRATNGEASSLPVDPGCFTFGLVARGVVEKGWEEALAAARIVRQRSSIRIRLVFVGAGPCIDSIAKSLTTDDREWIVLAGQQDAPESWVRGFDVGLLPSHLKGESLPNTIIEYLACGKPVIATSIGGIPEMVRDSGILIPLATSGRADVPALAEAMLQMMEDDQRQAFAARVSDAFTRYSMPMCVSAYESEFAALCER